MPTPPTLPLAQDTAQALPPTPADVSAHLATQVWQWLDGDPGGVLVWLQRLGCRIVARPEHGDVWTVQGVTGINVGLPRHSDPVSMTAQLGFAVCGALWPQALPGYQAAVNKEWHRRTTAAKAAKEQPHA
jgi:hypothetical protein